MKIKQKLSIGFIVVIILVSALVSVNFFIFYKINAGNQLVEKINNLSSLLSEENYLLNNYAFLLLDEKLDERDVAEELLIAESDFLAKHKNLEDSVAYLKHSLKKTEKSDSLDLINSELQYSMNSFLRVKDVFVNKKTFSEKKNLSLASIIEKRIYIETEVFINEFKVATSSNLQYLVSVSDFNEIKAFEALYLYSKNDKKAFDNLAFLVANFEFNIKKVDLFKDRTNLFLAFDDYLLKLENYLSTGDDLSLAYSPFDYELKNTNKRVNDLIRIDNQSPLFILSNAEKNRFKYLFNLFIFLDIFFFSILVLYLFLLNSKLTKTIIRPLMKLSEFALKIANGQRHDSLQIESGDEIGALVGTFNKMDQKLSTSNDELNKTIDKLKIKNNIESLIESLTDGIIMYNKKREIILKNSAVESILSISEKKLSLKNLYSIFAKQNLEFHIDLSLRTDQVYRIDKVDLSGRLYEIVITQVADYDNKIIGGLIIFHKKDNETNIEIENSETFDFKPVISSHFGTPLAYIKLFSEMLSSGQIGELNKEQRECILNINKSAISMKEVIDKLHDIAALNRGELKVNAEEIKIVIYLKELIEKYQKRDDVKNININFKELLPEDIKVNIDKDIFSKVLDYILHNSLVYRRNDNPFIDIEIKELGFNYLLSIKDNGIGIIEEEQDFVFDKFFRGKNAMIKNTKGSGLSLYIAKKILNDLGVELFFESKIGEGSTFFIEIPKGGMRK